MLSKLTHEIATVTRRRWMAATAGLVLGLAASRNRSPARNIGLKLLELLERLHGKIGHR